MKQRVTMKHRFRFRLRTLLLTVNVVVMLLPLAAVYTLHLYENELIRRTESGLISQGALLAATYKQAIIGAVQERQIILPGVQLPVDSPFQSDEQFIPIKAGLNADKENILPPPPEGLPPEQQPDKWAILAGESIEPILREGKRITLTGVRVLDYQGIVVASSGTEKGFSLVNRKEIQQALHGYYAAVLRQRISDEPDPDYDSISRGSNHRVFVAMPVVHNNKILGVVALSRSTISMGKGLYHIRSRLLRAAPAILIAVILFSVITTLIITAPLKALIRQAHRIRQGDSNAVFPLKHPGTAEVADLSQSIVEMATSLEERASYIKTFASNVSHEFKTPLASLKGSVELLGSYGDDMSREEREKFLSNMGEDIERLERMVRRLLELARADVITPGTASCDVHKVMSVLNERYRQTGRVQCTADEKLAADKLAEINMGRDVLESILVNMIANSLLHGGPQAEVSVTAQQEGSGVELLISNSGREISAANREKIFRPFFTTARESGGSGLGLTIVQSLVTAHGGTIELLPDRTTTFRIVLSLIR